jgi:hypothetical protein
MATKSKPVPKTAEGKHEKFVRLGEARMNRAIKSIEGVGKLSGSGYEYSDEDAKQLLKALAEAVSEVALKFHKATPKFMFIDR